MIGPSGGSSARWSTVLLSGLGLIGGVALLAIWARSGQTAHPDPPRDVRRLDTPVRSVAASGTDEAVCKALIEPYGPKGGNWNAQVLASGPDGLGGTWLFCEGETSSGIGAIAARSSDNSRWTTQRLPIAQRNHAGDEVQVNIASQGRVSLTRDSLVGTGHYHVWTIDGGNTWFGLLGYQ